MNLKRPASGFAIFSVILSLMILSLIGAVIANTYLANTRATVLEIQRLKAKQLLDSGIRFAALSIVSPRATVSSSAVPTERLVYVSGDSEVVINIKNEAGLVDLLTASPELLKSVLLASGGAPQEIPTLLATIKPFTRSSRVPGGPPEEKLSHRNLSEVLKKTSISKAKLRSLSTLHNGQKGVHPSLASEEVLALIPRLAKAERDRLLLRRKDTSPSLVSNPVRSEFFTSTISAYYRINVSVELQGQLYSRVQIIKIINQPGKLFEVEATL